MENIPFWTRETRFSRLWNLGILSCERLQVIHPAIGECILPRTVRFMRPLWHIVRCTYAWCTVCSTYASVSVQHDESEKRWGRKVVVVRLFVVGTHCSGTRSFETVSVCYNTKQELQRLTGVGENKKLAVFSCAEYENLGRLWVNER